MSELVLDASVVVKWFSAADEEHHERARVLATRFTQGQLRVIAPRLLLLELLNAATRGWRWTEQQLTELAVDLTALRFDLVDPHLADVVRWAARGLTAYDAAYVAVAETTRASLVTEDRQILRVAPGIARSLADVVA